MGSANPQQLSHATMQFLNHVLSQGGPTALPYEESLKWSIRQQVCTVIQEFPGLQVKPASYTYNDGRAISLLLLEGTLPMYFQGVKYNIPVNIWLLEGFPKTAPLVYVTPTRDMIVKPRHPHVDASGSVSIPYLHEWVFPRSNLADLVQVCSAVFGQEPPLYSRPASMAPPRNPPSFQGTNPMHLGSATQPALGSPGAGAAAAAARPSPSPSPSPSPYMPSPATGGPSLFGSSSPGGVRARPEDPEEVFKRNAVIALTERLQKDVALHNKEGQAEMERLLGTQQQLNQRADMVERGLRELLQEKEALEQQLQLLLTNTDVIEEWLKVNDKGPVDIAIDTAFEPVDVWSKQALEATAADLTLEDILYALDKAVQEDDMGRRVLGVEPYLRYTRSLSREQFMHRALGLKVRAAQMQAQVAVMASRAPYQGRAGS